MSMPNIRTVVERVMHLQLQHFTNIRMPVPFFPALIALSSFSSVAGSISSLSALNTRVWKAITNLSKLEAISLLNTLYDTVARALNTSCLCARIYLKVPVRWQKIFEGGHRVDYTYATPRAEANYWRIAERYRRRLYSGNSAMDTSSSVLQDAASIPLVSYYTPRLLPLYRNRRHEVHALRQDVVAAQERWVSSKTFCKWHRMVFQGSRHPTLTEAALQMKHYSNRDLREIRRISRLLPDEEVFGRKGRETSRRPVKETTKYGEMWERWLENKGADLVIVFE